MGPRLLFALGFFTLCSLAEGAGAAVPATCLSTLPAEPGTPVFTLRLNNFSEVVDLAFWRQACADDSREVALLMRATPSCAWSGSLTSSNQLPNRGITSDASGPGSPQVALGIRIAEACRSLESAGK